MAGTRPDRRAEILAAALTCFLADGYRATTIATIRERSGASTGSIYHFFGGKASLAAALLEEAVAGWSAAGPDALDPAGDAERSIRASVGGFVAWGTANPALFRFLDEIRTLAATDRELAVLRERLEAGQQVARRRYENAVRDGRVRGLSWPLAHSLMLGPAYNYLRFVAAGQAPSPDAPQLLADAAWAAVRREAGS